MSNAEPTKQALAAASASTTASLEKRLPRRFVRRLVGRDRRGLRGRIDQVEDNRRGDCVVYHTYSAYARGLDGVCGMYQWLDRAPKGRNETDLWFRRHNEYNKS